MSAVSIDFESEGLLDGLEGEARDARRQLLSELADDGVSLEELRAAVQEDRLAMLPVERVYSPQGERYTLEEVAERSGVPPELLARYQRALGIRVPESDEKTLSELDLEAATLVKGFIAAGVPEDRLVEGARVIGLAISQISRAVSQLTAESILSAGDTERDVAIRLAAAARELTPMTHKIFEYTFQAHQLEVMRSEIVGSAEIATGQLPSAEEYTVCFADLVGFTRLGEDLEPTEYGAVTERLGELAAEIAEPPVRLVKLIGDAAMLASRETEPVLGAALALQSSAAEADDLPELRVGVARGSAIPRAGDLYGRAVNLASRLTAIARPGSVLCDAATKEAAGDAFDWSYAGSRRIKGIDGQVRLFRARPEGD